MNMLHVWCVCGRTFQVRFQQFQESSWADTHTHTHMYTCTQLPSNSTHTHKSTNPWQFHLGFVNNHEHLPSLSNSLHSSSWMIYLHQYMIEAWFWSLTPLHGFHILHWNTYETYSVCHITSYLLRKCNVLPTSCWTAGACRCGRGFTAATAKTLRTFCCRGARSEHEGPRVAVGILATLQ